MSIRRAPRPTSHYHILDKRISEDRRLSWAARGMLIYLLGKPDHWRVSIPHLIAQTEGARIHSSRDAVYKIIGELKATGYIRHARTVGEDGRFIAGQYEVCEIAIDPTPEPENPDEGPDEPLPDFPDPVPPSPNPDRPNPENPDALVSTESIPSTEKQQGARENEKAGGGEPAAPSPTPPPPVPAFDWLAEPVAPPPKPPQDETPPTVEELRALVAAEPRRPHESESDVMRRVFGRFREKYEQARRAQQAAAQAKAPQPAIPAPAAPKWTPTPPPPEPGGDWKTWMPQLSMPEHRWSVLAPDTDIDPKCPRGSRRHYRGAWHLSRIAASVLDAMGINDHTRQMDWRPLCRWLDDGIDPHDHIIPTIREITARRGNLEVSALAYFDKPVREAAGMGQRRVAG